MRLLILRLVLFVAVVFGSIGLKGVQFRLEGLSADQSHLLSNRGNGGGPSHGGIGIRRVTDQDKKDV